MNWLKTLFGFATPYLTYLKWGGIMLALIGSFFMGIHIQRNADKAAQVNEYTKKIGQMEKQDKTNRTIIKSHQENEAKLQIAYILLGEELKNAKGKLGKCKSDGSVIISPNAVLLWDSFGEGEPSKDSAGTSENTSIRDSIEPEVTLEMLYENRLKNAEICNGLRKQILAIIQWDKKTFGDR